MALRNVKKDLHQASLLVGALTETRRISDLAEISMEGWERGEHWQQALAKGLSGLGIAGAGQVTAALRAGMAELGENGDQYLLPPRF